MADASKRIELSTLIRLDLDWQQQRENFLDWGCEPRFPTLADVVVTFALLRFYLGRRNLAGTCQSIIGAAGIAIAVFFTSPAVLTKPIRAICGPAAKVRSSRLADADYSSVHGRPKR